MPITKTDTVAHGPSLKGVDFAWRPANIDADSLARALKAIGVRFVVRYISHDTSKNLTAAEIAAYRKYGIRIVVVFEDAAERALSGGSGGVEDAMFVKQYLRGLGAPGGISGAPVYFAMDFDMQPSQRSVCANYIRGASQVLGRSSTGIYGGLAAVEDFRFYTKYQWQTVAWSGGTWFAGDELKQFAAGGTTLGVQWDLDETNMIGLDGDIGQWKYPGDGKLTGSGGNSGAVASGAEDTEDGMLIHANPAGKQLETPLAIPAGTSHLHFVCASTAKLSVQFHGAARPDAVNVDWKVGSSWVLVPADVHAAVVTREDTGNDPVHLTWALPASATPVPAAPAVAQGSGVQGGTL